MKVLQLIDSLHAGGAERVAVNFANALVLKTDGSFICATREEGVLKNSINKSVSYLFLNKKYTLDIRAIKRLHNYVRINDIDIIHAHSSSFFLATLVKFLNKKLKIVWHDHYGNSEFLEDRKSAVLRFCSKYFSQVFCVNEDLVSWGKNYLSNNNIKYLPNYAVLDNSIPETELYGLNDKRIVCLANFRPQKDHFTLIEAFNSILVNFPEWSLHCVGKDFNDEYSLKIKEKIHKLGLSKNVYLYNSKSDISNILKQCQIGVLSSKSEGLPLALLEYGLANLAVISTNVGDCKKVIQNNVNGILVEKNNFKTFGESLELLISTPEIRNKFSENLNSFVKESWSEKAVIFKLCNYYNKLSVLK